MFASAFSLLIYNPLYNGLIALIDYVPYADVGIALILLTIIVKVALIPIAKSAIRSQIMMNSIKGELDAIKEKYKNDRQKQAEATMLLYKEKGINPFSMIVPLLVQIPIIFGLYWVFFRGGLPNINLDILYSFVHAPAMVNMNFVGLINMSDKSIVLALLAAGSQYIQTKISFPKLDIKSKEPSFQNDLARSMHIQMRYVLPVIIGIIAYTISAAIALYWTTSNIFAICQELFIRKRMLAEAEKTSRPLGGESH